MWMNIIQREVDNAMGETSKGTNADDRKGTNQNARGRNIKSIPR